MLAPAAIDLVGYLFSLDFWSLARWCALLRSQKSGAIDRVSAALECRREAAKHCIEHCAHEETERAALELIEQEKFDLAGVLADRMKGPAVLHTGEWTTEVFDVDRERRPVER